MSESCNATARLWKLDFGPAGRTALAHDCFGLAASHDFAAFEPGRKGCLDPRYRLVDCLEPDDDAAEVVERLGRHHVEDLARRLERRGDAVQVTKVHTGIELGDDRRELVDEHPFGHHLVGSVDWDQFGFGDEFRCQVPAPLVPRW